MTPPPSNSPPSRPADNPARTGADARQSTVAPRPRREELERPDREVLRGRLQAQREAEAAETPGLTLPLFLRKFCELCLFTVPVATAVAYPLQFTNEALTAFTAHTDAALSRLVMAYLPALQGNLPVLELKNAVFVLTALLVLAVYTVTRLYERLFDRAALYRDPLWVPRRSRPRRLLPIMAITLFLLWSFLSFFELPLLPIAWGPEVPPEAALALASNEGMASPSLIGASYHSLTSWLVVAVALIFFIVAEDLLRTRRVIYKILMLLGLLGIIATVVALALHAGVPGLRSVWMKFAPADTRNDVSAFIGHNVALSLYLLTPILTGSAALMANRTRWSLSVRTTVSVLLALMVLVLLLAQSRAVIPIGAAAFVALIVMLGRRAALRPTMTFYVTVPLALGVLILTQLVPKAGNFSNPLYRHNVTLTERLGDLTPTHLMTETRLRMIAASLPVLAERPLQGTGFGSFPYVFPTAQGEYYEDHPRSRIAPTSKRSYHAHNEYLQLWFETGLVGLLIALAGVGTVLWSGWNTLTRTLSQRAIALQLGVLVALLAMLAHAFFDFAALRVAPLCSMLLLLLAIWSAGDRLWLMPVPTLDERKDLEPPSADSRVVARLPNEAPPIPQWRQRLHAVLWGVFVFLAGAVTVQLSSFMAHFFSGQTQLLMAQQSYSLATNPELDPRLRAQALITAHQGIANARRIDPSYGETNLYEAVIFSELAKRELASLDQRREDAQADPAALNAQLRVIRSRLAQGLQRLNMSLAEVNFHYSYLARAELADLMAETSATDEEEARWRAEALEDLARSAAMNPGEPTTLLRLSQRLKALNPPKVEEAREALRTLKHFHPGHFQEWVLRPVHELLYLLEAEEAYREARDVIAVDPDDEQMLLTLMAAAYQAGDDEQAMDLANRLEGGIFSDYAQLTRARVAVRDKDMGEAERLLSFLRPNNLETQNNVELFLELVRAYPNLSFAVEESLAPQFSHDPQALQQATLYVFSDFNDLATAEALIRRRLRLTDPAPDAQAHLLLARILLRRNVGLMIAARTVSDGALPVPTASERRDLREVQDSLRAALAKSTYPSHRFWLRDEMETVEALLAEPPEAAVPAEAPATAP